MQQQRSPVIELSDVHVHGPVEQVMDAIAKIEQRKEAGGRPYNYVSQADTLFRATKKMADWEEQNLAVVHANPEAGALLEELRARLRAVALGQS